MHAKPGRDTERFYRLAEGEKLKLLDARDAAEAAAAGDARREACSGSPLRAKGAKPAPARRPRTCRRRR